MSVSSQRYSHGLALEQQSMRRQLTELGVVLCLNQIVIMGGAVLIDLLLTSLPPRLAQLSQWYADGELDDLIMAVVVLLGFIPVAFYNREHGWSLRQQLAPAGVSPGFVVAAFVFLFAANSLGSYLSVVYDRLFYALGFEAAVWEYGAGSTLLSTVMLFVYGVVVAPVMEEVVFRGVILSRLRPYGDRFAVLASAVLFGVMHGNFGQLIPTFGIGLVLGYVCVRTGSLRLCILLHALNNLLVTLMYDYWLTGEWTLLYSLIDNGISLLFIAAALVLFVVYRKALVLPKDCPCPLSPYQTFFCSVPILLFLIVYGLLIVAGYSPVVSWY